MYNKIFSKIVTSSIWLAPMPTFRVWIYLIATMDEDGFIPMACAENLALVCNVSVAETEAAVAELEGPDPRSSDPENDGKRIERVPGGWMVLNATKYREIVTRETMKVSTRERVRRHRDKKRSVTVCNGVKRNETQSEAVSESETVAAAVSVNRARPPSPPDSTAATTTASELELGYTKPEAQISRRLNLGDLEARHLALMVGREDREKARTLIDLYSWELCSTALSALEPIAKARTPGKQRIMVSELGQYLLANFDLEPADYKRAGLPIPEGLSDAEA